MDKDDRNNLPKHYKFQQDSHDIPNTRETAQEHIKCHKKVH